MECYLDNAATTRPFSEVCDLVTRVMYEDFGNPSSLHMKGVIAERYVRQAREQIAKTLKCAAKNIVFTSGGTESNNMALIGSALANARAGKHIITTCFEHAAVYEPLLYLEKMGYEVTYLPVDSMGHVSEETLENALRKDTILVSTMLVNNEVGAILDVEKFSKIVKAFNKDSGHKIHGPKGTGFLYVGDKVKIHPYIHGGGQQQGMRSGTENVPGIAGLSLAAEKMYANLEENRKHLYELKRYFVSHIGEVDGAVVNACDASAVEETAPHIVSVSFDGVRSEVLLHALEEKEIYVSSGSACSSNHPGISGTLKAIGVANERLDCTLRFSFSVETQIEQLKQTITELKQLVPVLARYTRR